MTRIQDKEQSGSKGEGVDPPSSREIDHVSSSPIISREPESLLRMCHVCTGRMVETNGFVPFWIEQRDKGTRLVPLECTCCGALAVARVKEAA